MDYEVGDDLNAILGLIRRNLPSERLNTIHEAVFCGCWHGQTYQDIADDLGYDAVYIRGVGSQLWQKLSNAFGEKITKSNFQSVLQHHWLNVSRAEPQTLSIASRAGLSSGQSSGQLSGQPPSHPSCFYQGRSPFSSSPSAVRNAVSNTPGSDYYIARPPIEARCYATVAQQGALIRIKAPRQMGKTSLMTNVLNDAKHQGCRVVVVSLRLADANIFADLDRFLQWFCAIVDDQLSLNSNLNRQWKPIFGSNYNCTQYFGRTLLPQLEVPVVVALDDVDALFDYPAIATDFLGLLRAWCEKAKHSDRTTDDWHKLKLLVVHSTEVYIPLHQHQSPFNVGLSIELPEFTPEQVLDLAQRYGVKWTMKHVDSLMTLVGGKPDLIRLTLDWVASHAMTLEAVLTDAIAPSGIYHEHLRQQFRLMQKYPDLMPLLQQVMTEDGAIALRPVQGFQLESLGMVKLDGQSARPSCELYRRYFGPLLSA